MIFLSKYPPKFKYSKKKSILYSCVYFNTKSLFLQTFYLQQQDKADIFLHNYARIKSIKHAYIQSICKNRNLKLRNLQPNRLKMIRTIHQNRPVDLKKSSWPFFQTLSRCHFYGHFELEQPQQPSLFLRYNTMIISSMIQKCLFENPIFQESPIKVRKICNLTRSFC